MSVLAIVQALATAFTLVLVIVAIRVADMLDVGEPDPLEAEAL